MTMKVQHFAALAVLLLIGALLARCPDRPDSPYQCAREGKPTYHTPSGSRCWPPEQGR